MADSFDEIEIRGVLGDCHTIAVVGLSKDSGVVSNHVCSYLKSVGYRIIPVRPDEDEIMGEQVYRNLQDIPVPVDIVYIFRKTSAVMPFVEEAIKLKPKAIWLPLGVFSREAEQVAQTHGVTCIMNTCMMAAHERLRLNSEI
ncbi:MAG: CoA-binding protein [Acidobacteriota bacterium]